MKVNERLHGFKVKEKIRITELEADLYVLSYEKNGARLVYIDREDENKTFSIAFRTPPEDSTGVFHILEHSVLCGSERFPLKDPFVELLKGSLNTFLNAMTFQDKTMYPVSSRNDIQFFSFNSIIIAVSSYSAVNITLFYKKSSQKRKNLLQTHFLTIFPQNSVI